MARRLLSLQTGAARRIPMGGRRVLTGMVKRPVTGPVPVLAMGLTGDEQADLSIHGGMEKKGRVCLSGGTLPLLAGGANTAWA